VIRTQESEVFDVVFFNIGFAMNLFLLLSTSSLNKKWTEEKRSSPRKTTIKKQTTLNTLRFAHKNSIISSASPFDISHSCRETGKMKRLRKRRYCWFFVSEGKGLTEMMKTGRREYGKDKTQEIQTKTPTTKKYLRIEDRDVV